MVLLSSSSYLQFNSIYFVISYNSDCCGGFQFKTQRHTWFDVTNILSMYAMIIISSLNGPPSSAGWLVLVLPKKTSITARLRCRRSIIVIVVFWASSYSLVVVFYSSPSCRSGSATKDNCIVFPKSTTTTNQSRAEQGRLQ